MIWVKMLNSFSNEMKFHYQIFNFEQGIALFHAIIKNT